MTLKLINYFLTFWALKDSLTDSPVFPKTVLGFGMLETLSYCQKHSPPISDKFRASYATVSEPIPDKQTKIDYPVFFFVFFPYFHKYYFRYLNATKDVVRNILYLLLISLKFMKPFLNLCRRDRLKFLTLLLTIVYLNNRRNRCYSENHNHACQFYILVIDYCVTPEFF